MKKIAVLMARVVASTAVAVVFLFLSCNRNIVQPDTFVLVQEPSIPSRYEKHGWNYPLKKIREVYNQEYNGEKILKNVFEKEESGWVCMIRGEKIPVPQKFIDKTIKHIQNMFDRKLIKYLFRLDCFHGHFFVDQEIYKSVYVDLDFRETTKRIMADDSLGILFHNFEHLKIDGEEEKKFFKNRNVVCWYNNKPLEILPLPSGKISQADVPGRNIAPPSPRFAAHKNGAFSIVVEGKEIKFDISFDDNSYW